MKIILLLSLLGLFTLFGCNQYDTIKEIDKETDNITIPQYIPEKEDVENKDSKGYTVKLSEDIINQAVKESQGKTNFGMHLGKVKINYVAGANVEAALVLHNGDDVERYVKLSYLRPSGNTIDADTGLIYEPAPIIAHGWVSLGVENARLAKMETKVISVSLCVPSSYSNLPHRWEFDIWAQGIEIATYNYEIIVTTVENDNVLEVHLPEPLLDGDINSVLSIISTIDEEPKCASYNSVKGILTVVNLAESSERLITINYEYGRQLAMGYAQRWLITMLK